MSKYSKIKLEDVPTLFGLDKLDDEWTEYTLDNLYILIIYLSIQFFDNMTLHRDCVEKLLHGKGFVYRGSNPFRLSVYGGSILYAAIDDNETESLDMYEIV